MSGFLPKSHVASTHGQGGNPVGYQSTHTSVQNPSAEKRWDGPNMEHRDLAQYAKRGEGPQVNDPRRVPSMDTEYEKSRNLKSAAGQNAPSTNIEDDKATNDQDPKYVMKSQDNNVTKGKEAQSIESRGAAATTQEAKAISVPKEGPASFEDIPPTDKVVLIMGPTGSGKSTFINYASGGDGKGIGHQLQSCTDTIAFTSVRYKSRKLGVANPNKPGEKIDRPEVLDVSHDNATSGSQMDANRPEDMATSRFNHPNHEQHDALHNAQPDATTYTRDQSISRHPDDAQPSEYGNEIGTERLKVQVSGVGGTPTFSGSKHLGNEKYNAPNAPQNTTTANPSVYTRQTPTRAESPAHALENPQSIRDDRAQSNNPFAGRLELLDIDVNIDRPNVLANINADINHSSALPGSLIYDRDQGTGPNTSQSNVSTIDHLEPSDRNDYRSDPMGQSHGTNHENSTAHGVNASRDGVTSNADESNGTDLDDSTDEQTIWFVDTPGFDDTYKSDIEILTMIAEFLIKARHNNLKLDTILYFHRITDNRMAGSPLKNLKLFASLCGNVAMPNVVLVMTMWSLLPKREIGKLRQEELEKDFWTSMLKEGCRVAEFGDSYESAHMIISGEEKISLSHPKKGQEGILLSKQLVDKHKKLKATEAGITLNQQLTQLIKDKKEANKRLKALSKRQNNKALRANLEAETQRIENSIAEVTGKIRSLNLSFPAAFKRFFSSKSQVPDIPSG
ncbi:hypothetical protein FRC20_000652 [Serendipita sp. 405]|nr:hypothetical protein FRC16_001044 [Serendipita sp. 398]KAG8869914.1 hypothetical protein FRC20_000652 [Serendipita sp. 405]